MSSLTVFNFESQVVRVVLVEGEPWWVTKDVAEVLGYADSNKMANLVEDEDKKIVNPQDYSILAESLPVNSFRLSLINESGLYCCMFNSTKPEAKRFKKWVTSEVIPTIRKTGSYSTPQPAPMSPAEIVAFLANKAVETERQMAALQQSVSNVEQKQQTFEDKVDPYLPQEGYVTFESFKNRNKYEMKGDASLIISRAAIKRAKSQDIELGEVAHPLKGTVKTYPEALLKAVLKDLLKGQALTAEMKKTRIWIIPAA